MSGGQPLRLGPFIGGLNIASDPTAIADAELVVCDNFELDIDGSLISRPPIKELDGHVGWTERIVCLAEVIFSGNHYVIGSNTNGVYHFLNGVWTLITSTFQACVAVQYANTVYLVPKPGSANPGGKWDPVGGFTAVAAIPQGQAAVKHKERLFIVPGSIATTNTSRLKFSDSGNFEVWGASNFIDISQGDGTNLVDITVFQNNLILFKTQSTYSLAYDTRPTDAVLNEISSTIGVNKQFNMVNYENQVYIFSGGWVYEIINYDFHRLNTKVPFVLDATTPSAFAAENIFLSLIEDRLVCRFHRNIYVYGLRTRTWSQWESESDTLHYFGPIVTTHPTAGNEYYSGSCVSNNLTTLKFYNESDSTTTENIIMPTITATDTYTRTVSSGWGTTDTGQVIVTAGGSASDFSTNGTKGLISLGTLAVVRTVDYTAFTKVDWDLTHSIKIPVVTTGAGIDFVTRFRMVDASNHYRLVINFLTTGTVGISIAKVIAGVTTALASTDIGAYSAADTFLYRIRIVGSSIKAKVWKSTSLQPGGWNLEATNAEVTATGGIQYRTVVNTGNTNSLPIVLEFDNLQVGNPSDNVKVITCTAKTKNFDMAVSHQYKRLWWWGADVTSDNDIVGKATPIVVSFNVTWGDLASYTWGDLAGNTWGQPLTEPSTIVTTASTGTGTARRFAKFLKSLRYRQINFEIVLTTEGSTVDGPARLFTLTIITETKQAVVKAVS